MVPVTPCNLSNALCYKYTALQQGYSKFSVLPADAAVGQDFSFMELTAVMPIIVFALSIYCPTHPKLDFLFNYKRNKKLCLLFG